MVRKIFLPLLILIAISVATIVFFNSKKNKKTPFVVYAYSSFAASWGVGPQIIDQFAKKNGIEVRLVDVGDARTILQRLELEKEHPVADAIIGLDQLSLSEAIKNNNWKVFPPSQITVDIDAPPQIIQKQFVAFDWAPITFIFRKGEIEPPKNFQDLLDSRFKSELIIFDPQLSAPGFLFFNWLVSSMGYSATADYYKKLKLNIFSVAPSWSAGYGLFKKKQAKLVVSYVTSPIYHWVNDHDETFQAASFSDPVPFQIEYAGVLDSSQYTELGAKLMLYLVSSETQKKIMNGNYMYPIVANIKKGSLFEKLPRLKLASDQKFEDKSKILNLWKSLR